MKTELLLSLIDTSNLRTIPWAEVQDTIVIEPKSAKGRAELKAWAAAAYERLRVKLTESKDGITCEDAYTERYVIGRPCTPEAVGGLVYEDHKQATQAAAKAGKGATVLSVRWVRERKKSLRLTRVMPPANGQKKKKAA